MNTTTRRPVSDYLAMQYPFHVVADPDGGYVVVFPDLPGCMTQVETLAELPAMAEDARTGWIEVEYERGNEIPSPYRPEEYSGKFVLRLPRSLHRALAAAAERERVSLNQYVVALLSAGPTWRSEGSRSPDSVADRMVPTMADRPRSTAPARRLRSSAPFRAGLYDTGGITSPQRKPRGRRAKE